MTADREALLERYGRFYGDQKFAVTFTSSTEGEDAKRVVSQGWDKTAPLADADFGAALVGNRGKKRNPVVVLRPSRLVVIECDTEEDLARIQTLNLPETLTVRSSKPYKRHYYFRPDPAMEMLPYVAFRFESGKVTADSGRYFLAPPSIHPSGAVYSFLPERGPGEIEIAVLPERVYQEIAEQARLETNTLKTAIAVDPETKIRAGNRRDFLFRYACMLRRWGLSETDILANCLQFNETRCDPPVELSLVKVQVAGAMKFQGGEEIAAAPSVELVPSERPREVALLAAPILPASQNQASEEFVLCAMMRGQVAMIESALETLEPNGERTFYRPAHGKVYEAVRALYLNDVAADPVLVGNWLQENGNLDAVGGQERLRELSGLSVEASNVTHHARIVREEWGRRELLAALREGADAIASGGNFEESLNAVERGLLVAQGKFTTGSADMYEFEDLGNAMLAELENPPVRTGVAPPFSFLSPLMPGRVYVVAGYTADGKSVIAQHYAMAAAKNGSRVGFFTIEMSARQLHDRMAASFGIPLWQVESRKPTGANIDKIQDAIAEMKTRRITLHDAAGTTSVDIHRAQRIRKYDLLIVDHLHQIILQGKPQDRRQLLEDEVHAITTIAKTEQVPVVLLAQLNRPQQGGYHRPTLSMLRETSRIEQQAWNVSFIWRERDQQGQPQPEAEFIVAKNRSGPTMAAKLVFRGEESRFVEVASPS